MYVFNVFAHAMYYAFYLCVYVWCGTYVYVCMYVMDIMCVSVFVMHVCTRVTLGCVWICVCLHVCMCVCCVCMHVSALCMYVCYVMYVWNV